MKKEIEITLNHKDIQDAIQQIEQHRIELLTRFDIFVKRLADEGVSLARIYRGKMRNYYHFESRFNLNGSIVESEIVMVCDKMIHAEWLQADGSTKSADINPILFEEFGSGLMANNTHASNSNANAGKTLGGQGTFPNQTHAFDTNGWWYKDTSGNWHHNYGYGGSSPLQNATYHLYLKVKGLEKEVFG